MASINDYLTGNANPEGLNGDFQERIVRMISSMPPELRGQILVFSAFRSVDHQRRLYENAIKQYGSEKAARKWVAPPGRSNHNHGTAIDLRFGTDAARQWAHGNAARFGLEFPMAHEPWHIEPAGLRNGSFAAFTPDPEAYTDGLGLTLEDNGDPGVQLARMAELMGAARTPGVGERALRTGVDADPIAAVEKNTSGILNEVR